MATYSRTRREMIERAIRLWQVHAESYRTIPLQYHFLLAEKRRLHITPLNKIKLSVLEDYPVVPFLTILDEQSARVRLEGMSDLGLIFLIQWIENMVSCNQSYRTLRNRIIDYNYAIEHHNSPECIFGFDPEYATCSRKVSTAKRYPSLD